MAKKGVGGGFIPHLGVVLYPRPLPNRGQLHAPFTRRNEGHVYIESVHVCNTACLTAPALEEILIPRPTAPPPAPCESSAERVRLPGTPGIHMNVVGHQSQCFTPKHHSLL